MVTPETASWWQALPSKMNPVLLKIGGFSIQWYGLMYLVAFTITYILAAHRVKNEKRFKFNTETLQSLMMAMVLGLLIGARLGYVIFYNLHYYIAHPLEIILPFRISSAGWHFTGFAGMSFHGGAIGVIAAAVIFTKKSQINFWDSADLFIPCIPLGYTFGRLGNFINGELYGRITTFALGMYFPDAPGPELRHPSQLYEGFFEGIVLWAILWSFRKKINPRGSALAAYLIGYGVLRFFIEYTRQPDAHLGFVFLNFSMGQVLCMLMILAGALLWIILSLKSKKVSKKAHK